MLTCDSFSENTLLQTQQAAECVDTVYGLTDTGLPDIQTWLLVLDSLERLGIGPDISDIPGCDVQQALRNATCVINPLTTPGDMDPSKVQGLVLVKLNEALCAL